MMRHFFIIAAALVAVTNASLGQDAHDSQSVVEEVISAVGGPEKLLRHFRMKERYHSGAEPTPSAGKNWRPTRGTVVYEKVQKERPGATGCSLGVLSYQRGLPLLGSMMAQILSHKSLNGRCRHKGGCLLAGVDLFENPEKGKDGTVESDAAVKAVFLRVAAQHSF